MLSWLDSEECHRIQAKSHLVRNAKNKVAYFRDFIGKKYSKINPTNSDNSAHQIEIDGVPSDNLQQVDEETVSTVTITELTTRHLIQLTDSGSDFLGCKVTGAVITILTQFSNTQKEALVAPAKSAELEVWQTINEQVAGILA